MVIKIYSYVAIAMMVNCWIKKQVLLVVADEGRFRALLKFFIESGDNSGTMRKILKFEKYLKMFQCKVSVRHLGSRGMVGIYNFKETVEICNALDKISTWQDN